MRRIFAPPCSEAYAATDKRATHECVLPSAYDLQYFLEVADTLNISRAAERLGIRQPTLSQALKRLETSVGTPLFIRNRTGVQLTHGGRRLVGEARRLLEQWRVVQAAAQREETVLGGRYSIGVHASVAMFTLPHVLPDMLRTFPELQLNFLHDHSRRITEEVVSFRVDFGIVVNPSPHPDLTIKRLYNDAVTLWVARSPSPLQDHNNRESVLIYDPNILQSQQLLNQLDRMKMRFGRNIASGNLELVAALTASGAGVGLLPTRVARAAQGQKIKPLSDKLKPIIDRHCLVYRADAQLSPASRTLSRWLRERLLELDEG
ncbi:MAG: LysR family transcriptional regulator [Myxococcota bacterium]